MRKGLTDITNKNATSKPVSSLSKYRVPSTNKDSDKTTALAKKLNKLPQRQRVAPKHPLLDLSTPPPDFTVPFIQSLQGIQTSPKKDNIIDDKTTSASTSSELLLDFSPAKCEVSELTNNEEDEPSDKSQKLHKDDSPSKLKPLEDLLLESDGKAPDTDDFFIQALNELPDDKPVKDKQLTNDVDMKAVEVADNNNNNNSNTNTSLPTSPITAESIAFSFETDVNSTTPPSSSVTLDSDILTDTNTNSIADDKTSSASTSSVLILDFSFSSPATSHVSESTNDEELAPSNKSQKLHKDDSPSKLKPLEDLLLESDGKAPDTDDFFIQALSELPEDKSTNNNEEKVVDVLNNDVDMKVDEVVDNHIASLPSSPIVPTSLSYSPKPIVNISSSPLPANKLSTHTHTLTKTLTPATKTMSLQTPSRSIATPSTNLPKKVAAPIPSPAAFNIPSTTNANIKKPVLSSQSSISNSSISLATLTSSSLVASTSSATTSSLVHISSIQAPVLSVSQQKEISVELKKHRSIMGDINNDWSIRSKAMAAVSTLVKSNGQNGFSNWKGWNIELEGLKQGMSEQLNDLRSSILREAARLLVLIAEADPIAFEDQFSFYAPLLFKGLYVTIKIMSVSCDDCLKDLVKVIASSKIIPVIINGFNDPHAIVREKCFNYLQQIISYVKPSELEQYRESIIKVLKVHLSDSDQGVRASGRMCFEQILIALPNHANALFNELPPAVQKAIDMDRKNKNSKQLKRKR